jgi:hypothetical protein
VFPAANATNMPEEVMSFVALFTAVFDSKRVVLPAGSCGAQRNVQEGGDMTMFAPNLRIDENSDGFVALALLGSSR